MPSIVLISGNIENTQNSKFKYENKRSIDIQFKRGTADTTFINKRTDLLIENFSKS